MPASYLDRPHPLRPGSALGAVGFVGSPTPGASTFANLNGGYAKRVPLRAGQVVLSIGTYIKGGAGNVGSLKVWLMEDNAGVPGLIIAKGPGANDFSNGSGGGTCYSFYIDTTVRWLHLPLFFVVEKTGPYWIAVASGINASGNSIALDAGSGSDQSATVAANATWPGDGTLVAYASSGNNYCLRAAVLG